MKESSSARESTSRDNRAVDPQEVIQVPGALLHAAAYHHRSSWGDMAGLQDSIAQGGIRSPLLVRQHPEIPGAYEIIAGLRRYRAGGRAGLGHFPCLVLDVDEVGAIACQVEENRQRADVHPVDEAAYCHELLSRGMAPDAIAKRLGMKHRDVMRRMRLLALHLPASAAYVAGKIDDAAAMAIASLTDASKQRDVIAAVESGALEVDEVAAYVQRTFTAQLDDVPWRMSDADLLPRAGACTTCPHRSDVQRDLFAEAPTGLRCLLVECHREKMAATWSAELTRRDVALWPSPIEDVFAVQASGRPAVMKSSGAVDADAPCPRALGRTWREAVFSAVEGEGPTVYLSRDQDGRPRFLMREAVVARLVRGAAPAPDRVAASSAPESKSGDRADETSPAAPPARAEARAWRAIVSKVADRTSSSLHDETWQWVARRVIAGATARSVSLAADVLAVAIREFSAQHGEAIDPTDARPALSALASYSNRFARRAAIAVLVFEEVDMVGELPSSVRELIEMCEIDPEELLGETA